MTLPFPERFSLFQVTVFCAALCVAQQLEGTTALFSLCSFALILIAVIAFNLAGGFTRPSGAFIFSFTVVGAVFGIVYKAFVVYEPGQGNLTQPAATIEVYVGAVTAMLIATLASRRLRFTRVTFPQFRSDDDMYRSAVGCAVIGGAVQIYGILRTGDIAAGSLFGIIIRLTLLLPLAAVIGVLYEVKTSGGRRSMNLPVAFSLSLMFANGIIGYSKEGIFGAFFVWIIPAAAGRYRMSLTQVAGIILAFTFAVYYLVPYSQYGRAFRIPGAPLSVNLATNVYMLTHLSEVRRRANAPVYSLADPVDQNFSYYNESQGLADRLQSLSVDDALINVTEQGAVYGIFPTLFYFENIIPHFIWPAKPILSFGNIYAHEVGIISNDEDDSTGVSFSFAGDAYHQAKWAGVLIMLPLLFIMMFTLIDSLAGDTRHSPIALLMMSGFLHSGSEGAIGVIVGSSTLGLGIYFVVAFVSARIMPLFANLLIGPARSSLASSPIRAVSARLPLPVGLGSDPERASNL